MPEGYDTEGYFRHVARDGLDAALRGARGAGQARSTATPTAQRLEIELDVIEKMRFPGYFLIVWDFIRHAKENGVPVGPGRGSGAGSIVAYSMRITDLDPIPYNLLFERFLNPERVSMPDFDVDFCMDRRDEVIALRPAEVRRGQRRADRHLRASSRHERRPGRGRGASGIRPPRRSGSRSSIPRQDAPPETSSRSPRRSRIEPKLKAMDDERRARQRSCSTRRASWRG